MNHQIFNESIKALIFDMDGVIADTKQYHFKGWKKYLEQFDVHIDYKFFIDKMFGTTGADAARMLIDRDMTEEQADIHCDLIDSSFRNVIKDDPEFLEIKGLKIILDWAKENNLKIALATSAPRENVDLVFSKLGISDYFDVIADKSMITKGKPDPEIYLLTLKLLGLKPNQALVFEDSLSGVKSGASAGITVIGITSGNTPQELISAGATHTANNYLELL